MRSGLYPKQEAQLMLINPCNAFRGQSKSPNIVLFHMLVCSSNFFFKEAPLLHRLQKNVVNLKSGS